MDSHRVEGRRPCVRSLAIIAFVALMFVGCAGTSRTAATARNPAIPSASCAAEPLASAPLSGESGVYRAGAVTLSIGEDLAQLSDRDLSRPLGSEAIALVTAERPVVVRVERSSRARFSLQFTPYGRGHASAVLSDGRAAVRFPVCGRTHRFGGGVLFAGTGCVRLQVQSADQSSSSMLIPIGNSLRGCPATGDAARLPASALPFLGVACGKPNSIVCDRVGVGVAINPQATLIVVQLAGRLVALSPPNPPTSDLWLGYLQGVSFRHGPLRIHIPPGNVLWFGSPEVCPRVRVTAFLPDGTAATIAGRVLLHPGFG